MRRQNAQTYFLQALLLYPAVVWLALHLAPVWTQSLPQMLQALQAALQTPFDIVIVPNTPSCIVTLSAAYAFAWALWILTRLPTRYGEEHGSARWGDPAQVRKKLAVRRFRRNRILTQHMRISYRFFRHRRNINVVVVGGSGAAKTRGYVMPNIMQNNCSQIILDPMGEILRGCGRLLEAEGTAIKVLDLIEMEKSCHYNPFVYLRNENDVQMMATYVFSATTPKGGVSQDPFWDQAAEMLFKALVFYLFYEAPPEEQNFSMVLELLRCAAFENEDSQEPSITDILFHQLEEKDPNHIAVRYYRNYRAGAGKTLMSIQLVLAAKLEKFNLSSLAELTSTDDLDLRSLGERKTALFLRISDVDKSYNFLIALLYNQITQQLFEAADLKHHGRLPVHVHFLMDEAANVKLPEELESYISTSRKRNISFSLILQNLTQLKAQFKDNWESIVGNCDEFLYLGGNEPSTHEFVSKQLGSETIWNRSSSLSRGVHGHASRSDQTAGRELLKPEEVRALDNDYCILFIRGYPPLLDRKYDLLGHPKIKQTEMGGAAPYVHGALRARPSDPAGQHGALPDEEPHYTILTEEEADTLLNPSESITSGGNNYV